ncbi:MAG TPA: histidine phosphatase family protein [Acidimicrobiia bacterium]|nr:histidine phosphatase family protein [Acidimicrobiia bacterium]
MTLLLVRHGQTAVNSEGRLQGRVDAPLTELGRDQAARLGVLVAPSRPRLVVASPLARARATAEAIAEAAGVATVEIDERLTELHYGDWDGQRIADLPEGTFSRWQADVGFAPPGGESLPALRARVVPCIEELLGTEGVVVAVSHVSPIKAALTWALGVGDEVSWRLHLAVASVSRLALRGDTPIVLSFNETAHLD